MREVELHKRLKHDNIVKLYTSFEDEQYVYLVLEYADKGNLFFYIRKRSLKEAEAYHYFRQTCAGIKYLHDNGLIHRDIKPENLLLSGEDVHTLKICDFGWCAEQGDEGRSTFCGTLEYMAPEMLSNAPHDKSLDLWSLGILLYELVHKKAPF
jgi:serine/threonine protein kinase